MMGELMSVERDTGGMMGNRIVAALAATTTLGLIAITPAAAGATVAAPVQHIAVVDRQDVASQATSEPDTVVEPDVAVSPVNPDVAIAAAHDSRFANGGAVDISTSWTSDGGVTWHHAPVPYLTTAVGGPWQRASDPVVQFAADGSAYLSTLVIDVTNCDAGVAVQRSVDNGMSWGRPVMVHQSNSCNYSDDKNWLVIDTAQSSPHFGRLYQFWTPFITANKVTTSPQVVRWSDDDGQTWSATSQVTPTTANTQNSQPMVRADGSIVDTYLDYGPNGAADGPERPAAGAASAALPAAAAVPTTTLAARTSTDGGMTWSAAHLVSAGVGGGPAGVRCCLTGAGIDPVTGRMYAVWEGVGPANVDPVELSMSLNGSTWSSPVRVTTGDVAGVTRVNAAVTAYGGRVVVDYGTRTDPGDHGGVVQQQYSTSGPLAETFTPPVDLGPPSYLQWSAEAGGHFPGDYIGASATKGRVYLVWCRSSQPPAYSTSPYHQTVWGAALGL